MASLEAAEAAHYNRLDAAYQVWLDEGDKHQAAIEAARTLEELEEAMGETLNHLGSDRGFDRYCTGTEDSVWACGDCGSLNADPDDGCQDCGFGCDPFED